MATSTSSVSFFNGSSTYSDQLQQTIQRALTVASLPLSQLQSTQTTLTGQQVELQTIASTFNSMQTAINTLTSSTGSGAFAATVSAPTVATASVSSGVMAGTYTLDVLSTGSQTNTISADGLSVVSDPSVSNINAATDFTLTVNGQQFDISDPSGTLNGLAQAINNSSANLQASIINVGSSDSPDYRLSIQSLNYAPDSIQLSDGTNNLLNTLSTGSNVTYQVNGQPSTPISSNTRNITLSPGLNVQIQNTGTTQVTVAQNPTKLASALSSFASAYNTIVAELNRNRGQNGGALSGDSIIYQLQNQLQTLTNFSAASGSIQSLADLGLTFDQSGNLNFNQATFNAAFSAAPNDVLNFLGDSTSGGLIQTASDTLTSITDSSSGILSAAYNTLGSELSNIGNRISDQQTKIASLQQRLTAQMAAVDSTIASLQNQVQEMTALFAQMQTNARLSSGY